MMCSQLTLSFSICGYTCHSNSSLKCFSGLQQSRDTSAPLFHNLFSSSAKCYRCDIIADTLCFLEETYDSLQPPWLVVAI